MKAFNPKEFKVSHSQRWQSSLPWGNGHTHETDPTRKGWRLKGLEYVAVMGQTGVAGCVTVVCLTGGYDVGCLTDGYDVGFHSELKPEEAFRRLKEGEILHADEYRQYPSHGGWALPVIARIEAIRRGEL